MSQSNSPRPRKSRRRISIESIDSAGVYVAVIVTERPKIWALMLAAAATGLGAALAWAAPEPARVSTVALGEPSGGRVVLELNRRVDHRAFLLDEPMRLVVDLADATWSLGRAPAAGGMVAGYRYGQGDAQHARLVIDLAQPARVSRLGYDLASPRERPRLVLELEPVTRVAFAAEAQPWVPSGNLLQSVASPSPRPAPAPAAAASAPPPSRAAPPPRPEPSPTPRAEATPRPEPAASAPAPREAMAAPAARPPSRAAPRRPVIVLDAGHGGSDPGTVGIGGVHEKDVTLAVVREMRRVLEASGRYVVRLTRDGDELIRLRDRIARARAAGADVFVSVHADSIGSSETRGASVYTLSDTASDAEAAALAQRENRADIIAGVDLSHESKDVASILIDLAQRETMNSSARFAQMLVEELGKDVRLLPNNPHRFAGFAVLKAPDTPALLLELGYLSNREDAALLRSPEHRRRLAQALLRAIDQHFGAAGARPAARG